MNKRVLSIIITLVMLVSVLSACASKPAETTNPTPAGTTKEATQTTKAPILEEPVKLVYYSSSSFVLGRESDPEAIKEIQQVILKDLNIELDFIFSMPDESSTKLNLLFASGEQVDMWEDFNLHNNYAAGMIADISDSFEIYGVDAKRLVPEEVINSMLSRDGAVMGFPRAEDRTGHPIQIRKDWLDQYGLAVPKTIDGLEIVLETFKNNDPAGNGSTIVTASQSALDLANSLIGGWLPNGIGNWMDNDGKIKPYYLHPNTRDYLARMNDWYKKGYLDAENMMKNMNDIRTDVRADRLAVSLGWYSKTTIPMADLVAVNPNAEYITIQGMTGPEGLLESGNVVGGNTGYVVSARCENIDAAVRFLNYPYTSLDKHLLTRFGIEGKDWEWVEENITYNLLYTDAEAKTMRYYGDFFASNITFLLLQATEAGAGAMSHHYKWINEYYWSYDKVKWPVDRGFPYNRQEIEAAGVIMEDINTIVNENMLKFIMGARPLSEFDDFHIELERAGVSQYVDEITRQFTEWQ